MQIQHVNNYQEYNNNALKTISKNQYALNKKFSPKDVSFTGLNISKASLRAMASTVTQSLLEAGQKSIKMISKAKTEIEVRFNASKKVVDQAEAAFQDLGNGALSKPSDVVTTQMVQEALERVSDKELELLNMQYAVDGLKATAAQNMLIANELPKQLAELDFSKELERLRLIRMQSSGGKHTGFQKIAGYEKEKALLEKLFLQNINLESRGKASSVPDFFIFFGPTGNGKTTISQAIAEETGCDIVPLSMGFPITNKTRKIFMQKLMEEAEQAKVKFKQKSKRTILFIDELTQIVSKSSNVLREFEDFANSCSQKYHCTIFGATNHISEVGLDFKVVDPIIMSFDPPTRENTIAILKHYLKDKKLAGPINYEFLADAFIAVGQKRGGTYSNAQIEQIVKYSFRSGCDKISQEDVLDCLNNGNKKELYPSPIPTIDITKKAEFDEAYKKYILGQNR